MHRQLANAQDKLERAQRHAEEKRHASQQTIERLQREYEQMDIERRENDKQVEEFRKEADEVEAKVRFFIILRLHKDTSNTCWQMTEHLKKSETELNELLTEYWKLRHETGLISTRSDLVHTLKLLASYRSVHGNTCKQTQHERHFRLIYALRCTMIDANGYVHEIIPDSNSNQGRGLPLCVIFGLQSRQYHFDFLLGSSERPVHPRWN